MRYPFLRGCTLGATLLLLLCGCASAQTVVTEQPTPAPTVMSTSISISTPEPTPQPTPAPKRMYVTGDGVRLRETPDTEGEILGKLDFGTALWVLEWGGEWCHVRTEEGEEGYMSSQYLQDTMPTPLPTDTPRPTEEPMQQPLPERIRRPRIVVKKADRKLLLYDGETLCGQWPVALGWAPVGYKNEEGDGRTPEGEYYVCTRNENSAYYLSLGLSYPNKEDAQRGLAAGTIDQSEYNAIVSAIGRGVRPPWDTGMGGAIMIHGNGASRDWTAGCIAVEDEVMDILWKYIKNGTKVTITS